MLHPVTARGTLRLLVLTLAAGLTAPGLACADDPAQAATLLENGKRLMASGHNEEACPKIAESQKLAPDIGTLILLADCNGATGKTATAWRQYGDAADHAAQTKDPREAAARKRVAELAPKVGRLVIVPPAGAKASLGIDCDGVTVRQNEWRTELPMDPGTHRVTASTLVGGTWSVRVVVPPEGGVQTVTIPDELIGRGDTSGRPVTKQAAPDDDERPAEEPAPSDGSTQRTIGLVVGGVGVVGLGLGAFFGFRAKSKLDDSNAGHCAANDRCDATGVTLRSDYTSAARFSTVGFIAGGVLLAGGVVLYLTAPRAPVAVAVNGGAGSANLVIRAAF